MHRVQARVSISTAPKGEPSGSAVPLLVEGLENRGGQIRRDLLAARQYPRGRAAVGLEHPKRLGRVAERRQELASEGDLRRQCPTH
jgi:hypothetical protein